MSEARLAALFERQRRNAVAAWIVTTGLCAIAVSAILGADPVWGAFVGVVACIALMPPIRTRHPTAMVPWEVLTLAALPAFGRTLVIGVEVAGVTLSGRVATFVAVAAAALLLAVELETFTAVRMSPSFAVAFVSLVTTATAGVWALFRYGADTLFGTQLLFDGRSEHVIETALMWDFVAATFVGVLAGIAFELYFRRTITPRNRVPQEVRG